MKKPRKIENVYGIFKIENGVLVKCIPPKRLKEVHIPRLVKVIGESAFIDCQSIQSITIPDTVLEIGKRAFNGCKALEEINIPNSLRIIDTGAFEGCESLKEIRIPASVKKIGESAFENCKALKRIVLLNPLTEIGQDAFKYCPKNNLQNLIKEQIDAKRTFTVFAKIDARWSVNIKANNIKEVMQKIEKNFYAADFGEAYDIDYQVVNIETPDGKLINPQQ